MFVPLSSSLHWLLRRGTRRAGGSGILPVPAFPQLAPGAYTNTKAPGMRTPATATGADFNSSTPPGEALGESGALTLHRLVSNSTVPGSSTGATATVGASGGQPERAVYDD